MGRLYDAHHGWTREELDSTFGHDPFHAQAPTRTELDAELADEEDTVSEEESDRYGEDDLLRPWTELTDDGIKTAVREIVRTSTSDEEIKRRIAGELGYPHDLSLASHTPTDPIGRAARAIVTGLDGLVTNGGAMVMVLLHGPRGNVLWI